ncbi:MAG: DUF504 domain-containing protein [Planctomycetes bacterium]|nr:DUF504 domain-containing protein [Planctomycetota bacterium]
MLRATASILNDAGRTSGDDGEAPASRIPPFARRGSGRALPLRNRLLERPRTSREVYNRIRWDPNLDPAEFTVLCEERGAPVKEIPLLVFDPETIPWHRVLAYRRGDALVWDRQDGLERIERPEEQMPPARPVDTGTHAEREFLSPLEFDPAAGR